jgi:hypothetical protein
VAPPAVAAGRRSVEHLVARATPPARPAAVPKTRTSRSTASPRAAVAERRRDSAWVPQDARPSWLLPEGAVAAAAAGTAPDLTARGQVAPVSRAVRPPSAPARPARQVATAPATVAAVAAVRRVPAVGAAAVNHTTGQPVGIHRRPRPAVAVVPVGADSLRRREPAAVAVAVATPAVGAAVVTSARPATIRAAVAVVVRPTPALPMPRPSPTTAVAAPERAPEELVGPAPSASSGTSTPYR